MEFKGDVMIRYFAAVGMFLLGLIFVFVMFMLPSYILEQYHYHNVSLIVFICSVIFGLPALILWMTKEDSLPDRFMNSWMNYLN